MMTESNGDEQNHSNLDNIDISSIEKDVVEKNDIQDKSPTTMEDVTTTGVDNHQITISVSEPQKVGDGMGSYIIYKVTTITKMSLFKKNEFSTIRRFSDFLGLHDILSEKYLRVGKIIPPAPEKNLIGSTKVKMGQSQNDSGTVVSMEWIECRRFSLERFLNRIAQHPDLCVDKNFINFLESDQDLPRAVNTAAISGAGVMRLFNKVGETMNKITYKMDENDPWFEEKITEIDNLDTNMQKLHSAVKLLVQNRKDLAINTGSVAKSAALLSTCEDHTGLSRALSQLADVMEKVEILRSEQANSDLYILSETIKDYIGLFGAVKNVFHERVKVFQNWQYAQLQLTKRRENKAKIELSGRSEKLDQAQLEVEEWEGKVQRCQKEFDDISTEIKREMERFEIKRIHDLKGTIIKYLEDAMAHQKQLIKYWECFSPATQQIA